MSAQNGKQTPDDQLTAPARKRTMTVAAWLAIVLAVVFLVAGLGAGYFVGMNMKQTTGCTGSGCTSTTEIQLTETGSSLLYPLMKIWGPNYTAYNSNVVLAPVSSGSGAGQSSAENALVNIGASDGYLANASQTSLLNLPVAISAQLIYYNLPTVTAGHLNLNGTLLAMIYMGNITKWNDPRLLAAQSPAVQTQLNALSNQAISPLKRSDSSGDTFLFSSLCYMSWSGWTYKYSTGALSGASWTGETGNSGMVSGLQKQTGSIGYVGISYQSSATGLQYAALGDNTTLKNGTYAAAASDYIWPSAANISADVNLGLTHLQYSSYQLAVSLIMGGSPAGAINLTLGKGGTAPVSGTHPYPLANLEYTLVKTSPVGNTVTATKLGATVAFLQWAISYGNFGSTGATSSYLNAVNFIPLTPAVIGYDEQELAQIHT